jgi:hypothetical protein
MASTTQHMAVIAPGDIPLDSLLQQFNSRSDALGDITLTTIIRFLILAAKLRNDIILTQPATLSATDPPDILPPSIAAFLGDCCDLPPHSVDHCWGILKAVVWHGSNRFLDHSETFFAKYGHHRGLSTFF